MIHREPGVAPAVHLSGGAAKAAAQLGVTAWRLSISHTGGFAIASVLALGSVVYSGGS
jgi:holo-[acyl-carrier protein] synthase